MRPVKQGEFDGLCGLYSIINAIELTGVPGPRGLMHQQLFRRLVLSLPSDVAQNAIADGLNGADLIESSVRPFRWLARTHDLKLSLSQPWLDTPFSDMSEFLDALREQLRRSDRAIIINLKAPSPWHWTVLKSLTAECMLVRDSGRLSTLSLDRFSLSAGLYRFSARDTLHLTRRHQR